MKKPEGEETPRNIDSEVVSVDVGVVVKLNDRVLNSHSFRGPATEQGGTGTRRMNMPTSEEAACDITTREE